MARGGIKAIIASQFENSGVKKAQKEFADFGKSIKGALGAIGITASFSAVISALDAAGKAAAADAKSQALLGTTMRNVMQASDGQIASVEAQIQKFSTLYGIMDDNIRPAMSQFVRVTGDAQKATELTNLALNVSAGTGRDLQSVTIALGKAYQGNTTALQRLGLNVKGLKDPMGALAAQFDGAAAAAANVDPYQRIQVAFDNTQETIGKALLPSMNRLADFLVSDAWQSGVENVANQFDNLLTGAWVVADGIDNVVISINKSLANMGINVDVNKVLDKAGWLNNPVFKLLGLIGGAAKEQANLPDETSRLIYRRLQSLGVYDQTKQDKKDNTAALTAAKAAMDAAAKAAAKAAADAAAAAEAQAQAYLTAAKAAADLVAENKKLIASFQDVFKTKTEMGAFESAAVDAFTSIFDEIDQALGNGQILEAAANNLTAFAKTTQTALAAIAKSRDTLAGKIDVARTITSGVMGLANITSFLETTTKSVTETVTSVINGIQVATTKTFDLVTSGGLVDNFQKIVDKTKAFAKNLLQLKALGLNKNLFAQLVNAGADAGGATAQAIVDGGSDTISALNSLYQELALSASDIASTATDTLYEVGQQVVSNGFIEGLMSQESALQQAAQTLADAFAATFSADLKAGLDAALPSSGAGLNQYPTTMTGLAVGGGGGAVSTGFRAAGFRDLVIQAGVISDPNTLAKTVIDSVKKYERSNGSVWVAAQ